MSVLGVIKVAGVLKDYWKPILIALLCILMILMMIPAAIINLFLPAANPDFADDYISVADRAGISWAELLAYDTVRYNNELSEAEPFKSAFDFIKIDVTKYREKTTRVYNETTKKFDDVTIWVVDSKNKYNSYSKINTFLSSVGYSFDADSNIALMTKFLNDLSSSEEYDINISTLTLRDMLYKFDSDKQSWALSLAENLPQIYANGFNAGPLDWDMKLTPSLVNNNIPYYNQHDSRWGKIPYGSHGTISSSACGPTSVAMLLSGLGSIPSTIDLNNDKVVDPYEASYYSVKHGYRAFGGTDYNLFFSIGKQCNIEFTKYELKEYKQVAKELEKGNPCIISVHPGKFTGYGHFMVLTGVDSDGKVILFEP